MTIGIMNGLMKKIPYVAAFAVGICCLKKYMNGRVCKSQARLDGKVVIITGANTGIGKEVAKDLVSRGAKVYLACRSLERATDAVTDIQKKTGASADKLLILPLNLGSLKSVRECAKEFRKREEKLDILINNAGVFVAQRSKTEDGFETTFGVNHLGHFLLTNLLMDSLSAAPKSRIINVSSRAHQDGKINFDDLMSEKTHVLNAYGQSKLANVLFTRELAKRLKGTGITVYSLHPGLVRTEIFRDMPYVSNAFLSTLLHFVTWPLIRGAWSGAQTTIYCAVDENLANESGKYYSDCREKEPSKRAQDDQLARKLWDVSIKLVKLDSSEMHPKLK